MQRPEFAGWTWAVAQVDPSHLGRKMVRVKITLPDEC